MEKVMEIGSDVHKELFCRTFVEGHLKFEPQDLPWPELDEKPLELLRSLQLWTHARQFEHDAGPMIEMVAKRVADPMIREALELQSFEETRHARLMDYMIKLYDLPAEDPKDFSSPDPLTEFIDFGFEECLDSFGGFGLFELVRQSKLLPESLLEIFENVMREESHHIVFFTNWYAHRETASGFSNRLLLPPRIAWYYARALLKIRDLVKVDDAEPGAAFIVTGARDFTDSLTPRLVLETCVAENERRLAGFDRRLLMPTFVPRLARVARRALSLVPGRGA
ncbi:MAG: hypothetical protein CL938_16840 [Deltaproteobacteria bacterium]|jgi:hypothetical protein|nr:hypothetical protein [Deltaproteobacteria bacterium]